jgi:uncharacterized damage-inducible protein DinB
MLNPYASQLGALDPLEVIASTPAKLRALMEAIGGERAEQPRAPGKWSAREIVCHLADCEAVFAFRLRQTLAEDRHVIQPFDQEAWAKRYANYSVEAALATFSALRQWNLVLVRSFSAADLARPVNHPERGEMTLETIVETMGGHDRNHLKQIEEIAGGCASNL